MSRNRLSILVLALAVCGGVAVWSLHQLDAGTTRPNVVLLIIDTLRADRLGAYGFDSDTSPRFDALAAAGVRFDRVYAQSSWTRPSVGTLLTSLHPRSLGIYREAHDALDDRYTTLAEVLWAAGYRTLGATANPNINSVYRFDQGFDRYADSNVLFDFMRPEPGKLSFDDHPLPRASDLYTTLLEGLADEDRRPFYLQVNVMEVHEHKSYDDHAKEPYVGLFPDAAQGSYLRAVRQATDEAAGFVEAVRRLPGGENTLFVLTSDHGEGLDDHTGLPNSEGHGKQLHESHLRVPLLLYHPGGTLPAGRVVRERVRLLDLMPTILDLIGLQGPAEMQGQSLVPLLRDEPVPEIPDDFIAETLFRQREKISLFNQEWKYVENRGPRGRAAPRRLFPAGATETGLGSDLASVHPEILADLAGRIRAWEQAHPQASASGTASPLDPDEESQLRAIGYLE